MNIKKILKAKAYQNIPLTFEEGYELAEYAVEGCRTQNILTQVQSIAALTALHNMATYSKPKAYLQIAGIVAGIIDFDIKKSPSGFIKPRVPYVIDNCGMGGDHFVTANVSTLASLTAASMGVFVCKHGSPANADQGRHGSSDFVTLCGIPTMLSKSEIEDVIGQKRFGYIEALDENYKKIHQQTHTFAKLPHMNDLIGPLTHPVDPSLLKYKIVGTNHLVPTKEIIKAMNHLNEKGYTFFENVVAIRGSVGPRFMDGIDELSITKYGTMVSQLHNGKMRSYRIDASDFGIAPVSNKFLTPPAGTTKGDFSLQILRNEAPIQSLYMIAASTALILRTVGLMNLKNGFGAALEQLKSGRVYDYVQTLKM
jgi:anthranilate phosphoribosyltransferase